MAMTPRVSILIPNYNNGRQNSVNDQIDLIGDLLQSLHDTLQADPTPFEILAADDGSTDDSLPTLQAWARRTWPDGRPFLTLLQGEHTGRVSVHANRLCAQARGDIFVRLDGDVVCLTPQWVSRLCELFARGPQRLGVLAPKQLTPQGIIHACGDFIIHPSGYTHFGYGLPRHALQHPIRCDHAMGCFHVCRRQAFLDAGGYDPSVYRSETEDLALRILLKDWMAFSAPDIEFIHRHGLRKGRASVYDDADNVRADLDRYAQRWGFHRLAPDLQAIWERYQGTSVVWNPQIFSPQGLIPPALPPFQLENSDWLRYDREPAFAGFVQKRLKLAQWAIAQSPRPIKNILHLGSGNALVPHVLAMAGLEAVGLDPDSSSQRLFSAALQKHSYPAAPPRCLHWPAFDRLPCTDATFDAVLCFDQIEIHPNPTRLLGEIHRLLRPEGMALFTSRPLTAPPVDPSQPDQLLAPLHLHPYHYYQLQVHIQYAAPWRLVSLEQLPPDSQMHVVIAVKSPPFGG